MKRSLFFVSLFTALLLFACGEDKSGAMRFSPDLIEGVEATSNIQDYSRCGQCRQHTHHGRCYSCYPAYQPSVVPSKPAQPAGTTYRAYVVDRGQPRQGTPVTYLPHRNRIIEFTVPPGTSERDVIEIGKRVSRSTGDPRYERGFLLDTTVMTKYEWENGRLPQQYRMDRKSNLQVTQVPGVQRPQRKVYQTSSGRRYYIINGKKVYLYK